MNQSLPIQSKRSPPGPQGHWLVGNLPEFGRDLLGFLSHCAREHGTIVKFRLAGWTAYLLNDPSITLRAQDRMWMKVIRHTAYSCSRYEGINLPLDARLFD